MGDYSLYNAVVRAASDMQQELTQLRHEHTILINGAANQAKTIRTLNERNSQLEAEVTKHAYEVELIKGQGRKTRTKVRNLKKAAAEGQNHLGQALTRAEQAEEHVELLQGGIAKVRTDNRQIEAQLANRNSEVVSLKDAIARMQRGKELSIQYVTKVDPFRAEVLVDLSPVSPRFFAVGQPIEPFNATRVNKIERSVVQVTQTMAAFHMAPEHRRDVRAHAEIAQMMAKSMVPKIEQSILNALRGEETKMPDLQRLQYEERMRQQRQTYGTTWADF